MTQVIYSETIHWRCPTGVYFVTANCTGAGGKGRQGLEGQGIYFGGGGGGAWSRKNNIPVVPGSYYWVMVGIGSKANGPASLVHGDASWFCSDDLATTYCLAAGGKGAIDATGALGGLVADCVGDLKYGGGNGADGSESGGGGGGSSASQAGAGVDGVGPIGGDGENGAGDGGDGGIAAYAESGLEPGGGGGGAWQGYSDDGAGDGANGKIVLEYDVINVQPPALEYLPYPRTREHPLVDDLVCCMTANVSYTDGTSAAFSSSVIQHINKGLPGPERIVSVENGAVFGDALPQFREMLSALGAVATVTAPATGKTVRSVVARMCGNVGHVDGTKHEFAAFYDPAVGAVATPGSEWGVAVETEVDALLDMFEAVAATVVISS